MLVDFLARPGISLTLHASWIPSQFSKNPDETVMHYGTTDILFYETGGRKLLRSLYLAPQISARTLGDEKLE